MRRPPVALRSKLLPRLLTWASQHGLDVAALTRSYGVPAPTSPDDMPLVPLEALRALSAAIARELGDPLLGLHLSQVLTPADYGAVGFLGRSAGTLGAALELFVAHAGALNATWSVTLERRSTGVRMHQRIPREPEGLGPVGNVYFVCGLVVLARLVVGGAVSPTRAWVAHAGRSHPELTAFLGCPLEFGCAENGLEIASSTLSRPLTSADPELAGWLERAVLREAGRAGGGDPLAEVRRMIRESLPSLTPLRAVARALGQSARSLQRRLASERTSYAQEVDRVRREVALELLADSLALGEVAYRCGFSDARAFSRAFKRWTGVTPGTISPAAQRSQPRS